MTQQAEHAWASDVLTPDEMKQYLRFEAELKSKFTPEDEKQFTEKKPSYNTTSLILVFSPGFNPGPSANFPPVGSR